MDGYRLRELMREKNISFYELEEKTGIPRSTLNRWANNSIGKIGLENSIKICDALCIDTSELFDLKNSIDEDNRLLKEMKKNLVDLTGAERDEQLLAIEVIEESVKDKEFALLFNENKTSTTEKDSRREFDELFSKLSDADKSTILSNMKFLLSSRE